MNIPLWSIIPFILVVLSVAILPGFAPDVWKKHRVLLIATFAIPIISLTAAINTHWLVQSFVDYVSFICLLGALYSIGGGLLIGGATKANPLTNIGYLIMGALLSNVIGTLGASMLLIRPILRSNRGRKHTVHVVVFFLFIVSNVGGLLTPLGDPPLLFGFFGGVPFWWTLKLFPIWLFVVSFLIAIFATIDSYYYIEDSEFREPAREVEPGTFHIAGQWNLVLIPFVMASLLLPELLPQEYGLWRFDLRIFSLVIITYVSRRVTPELITAVNGFSWEPFKEVALIFAGIFATMVPAVKYLEGHATSLGVTTNSGFFWLTGVLSSLLDNAPTFAAFFAVAQGLGKDAASIQLDKFHSISEGLLTAISCGAVFFGAMTYIGNGPNLLVKALAEENDVPMPSFFTYMLWSVAFLLPVLFLTGVIFFE